MNKYMHGTGTSLKFFRKAAFFSFASVILASSLVAADPPQRIHTAINESERFALPDSVRPATLTAKDQGPTNGSKALPLLTLHFAMSSAQKADLLQLLQQQQTRGSSQFHQWLTPEQYADRFGMNANDIKKVTTWLENQGFTQVQTSRSRTFVTFAGTVAQAQSAFHTSIHNYVTNDGVTHFANATPPEFPKALNGMVESLHGIHDFRPHPHLQRPRLTSNVTGNHFLVPDDWATIYDVQSLYNTGIDGSGRTIAIPGQTDLVMSDIETFQSNTGHTVIDPQVILVPYSTDPGLQIVSGDLGESDLDIEWAGGIAKGASIIFVTSTNVLNSESYIVDNNVADVLAITYGECEQGYTGSEMASLNSMFQQAASQGITVTAASGDQGAADCDDSTATYATQGLAVDVPASSPWVTGVGGTEFNEGDTTGATTYWSGTNNGNNGSALMYIPEIGWNDTTTDGTLTASGGGYSTLNAKPSWQAGTGVPNDSARDVPDVAIDASADHDGYVSCTENSTNNTNTSYTPTCVVGLRATSGGDFNISGGSSAASPTFAAVMALLDEKLGGRQGLVNPTLYALATTSSNAFHDITSGNNIVPCLVEASDSGCKGTTGQLSTMGYSAGTGYDQVTGLGSIDAYNLLNDWNTNAVAFTLAASPYSLTIAPGSSGSATITVAPVGSFSGNVTFTCALSSNITNTTCSVPGTVSGGSGTVTVTISPSSSAHTPWWHRLPKAPTGPTNRNFLFALAAVLFAIGVYLASKQRRMQALGFAFTVLIVVGITSCGGGSSSSGGSTATLSSISISPASPTINVGGTQQFNATGTYSDGTTAAITTSATWTSSNTAAATIAAGGLATGVSTGTSNITASMSGISSSPAVLTVTPQSVTGTVTITGTSGSLTNTVTIALKITA